MKFQSFLVYFFIFLPSTVFSQKQSVESDNLSFSTMRSIENKGQWSENILFKTTVPGGDMFLEKDGFTYSFIDEDDANEIYNHHHESNHAHSKDIDAIHYHGLKIKFDNSNKDCKVKGINPHETKYNYFIGNDNEKWGSGALAYKGVEYNNLYNGIDLYLYEKDGNKKYDFVVDPNNDPKQIILDYQGEDKIFIENGDLHIKTSVNEMVEKQPTAYQIIKGKYVNVDCNFIIDENNKIHFDFPKGYDPLNQLVIDPELIFSTLTGSASDNWGTTATYDNDGNAYSGGIEYANGATGGYPTTTGAFQISYSGGLSDLAICKYSPDGTQILYATYIGGSANDVPTSMIVNSKDELVILGNTNSNNFPTQAAFDADLNNGFGSEYDLFISILSPTGSNLIASTYVGGANDDGYNKLAYFYSDEHRSEIIVDSSDNIYVASSTSSSDFPMSGISFDNSYNGGQDGCVLKMNSNLSNLIWSGFLGGSNIDNASGIVLDKLNNVYVCGGTEGGFPITSATINQTFKGGFNTKGLNPNTLQVDGFVTKIANNGSTISSSTYIQSDDNVFDIAFLINIDIYENIYVYGVTEGEYPISSTVYNNQKSAQFIHKLNSNLTSTIFSSTFGSGSLENVLSPTAFLVDECNRIYVSGWGGSSSFGSVSNVIFGFPVTSNAFRQNTDGQDFYLAVFNEDMKSLEYATYFGGDISAEHVDGGTSRFSPEGIVYQSVCASCGGNNDFPTTAGVVSNVNGTIASGVMNCNNGLFKMEFPKSNVKAQINELSDSTQIFCIPDITELVNFSKNGSEYTWLFGDGNSLITSSDSTIIYQYDNEGQYKAELIVYNPALCFDKHYDTANYIINVFQSPISDAGNDTIMESCLPIELKGCCGPFYSWSPIENLSDVSIPNPILSTDSSVILILTITDSLGCTGVDSVNIKVIDLEPVIPNIFTPNDDGFNDLFEISSNCEYDLILFNRWGREVYKREGYQNNFDGAELNDGIYYYLISNELEQYKGWVQIYR